MARYANDDFLQENAVVDGNGIVMLCDFGLSCIIYEEATYAQATSLTGTLRFTAPELVDGIDRRNKASDVWAFGCTAGQVRLEIFSLKRRCITRSCFNTR